MKALRSQIRERRKSLHSSCSLFNIRREYIISRVVFPAKEMAFELAGSKVSVFIWEQRRVDKKEGTRTVVEMRGKHKFSRTPQFQHSLFCVFCGNAGHTYSTQARMLHQ